LRTLDARVTGWEVVTSSMNDARTRGAMSDHQAAMTIPGVLHATARDLPDAEAYACGSVRLTYAMLADRVREVARACIASEIGKGDRVALWAPNSERWAIAALGIVSTGAILVPINTRLKGAEARYILETSQASKLIVEEGFLGLSFVGMLREADGDAISAVPVASLPDLDEIIVFGTPEVTGVATFASFLDRAEGVSDATAAEVAHSVSPDDVSDIIFTSGTTGRPKGAMLLHGQTIKLYTAWSDNAGLTHGDRYLGVNPFFHCFGYKAGLLACVIKGATMVPVAAFDPVETMALIEAERLSIAPGTPTLYISLLDHPRRGEFDLSSLRIAVTGGSVVPTALIRRMRDDLGFETVINAYGLTEASGTVTGCRPDDTDEVIANTSGRAFPDVEVKVVGHSGEALPPGESGEIYVRGYNVMAGYYRDPDATAKAIDAEGWLHTGDVGVQDIHGNLRITDRTKDMFVVGGYNAYPAEIEQVVMHHDAVSEVAVIGMPDDRLGEVGRAYVVLRPGTDVSEEDLLAYCREHLANYKVPRTVTFADSLPRNGMGKVDKVALRALATQGAS
jgi:acyl-CoA synthetase (AMP-forming)/AMP-acid ligase II